VIAILLTTIISEGKEYLARANRQIFFAGMPIFLAFAWKESGNRSNGPELDVDIEKRMLLAGRLLRRSHMTEAFDWKSA